ncbi:MAG: hypothetical protein C0468_05340 [Planctomyces sp.]|nr:hypothetical protein [Planctomyces sp.]
MTTRQPPPSPGDSARRAELLCESCGYALVGIDHAGSCPECGRAVRRSLPAYRVGSDFQRSPSVRGFLRTTRCALTQPGAMFERVRIDRPRVRGFAEAHTALAALGYLAGISLAAQVPAVLLWPLLMVVIAVLSWIESVGLRVVGQRRSWRVSGAVAWTVVLHAMPGWTVGGVLTALGGLLSWARIDPLWEARLGSWSAPAAGIAPAAGALAGLLCFETLTYIGVRRCRFANPPPPELPIPPEPAPSRDAP